MDGRTPPMDPQLVNELSERLLSIARDVIGGDLHAMIVKGSAIKGDFIPDYSDFDVHLFADHSVMRGPLTPTLSIAIPFQGQFSEIDVASYRVSQIQVMIISAQQHPPEWIPALPGTYKLVYGVLPESLPEVTEEMIRTHAIDGLRRWAGWVDTILGRIVDKPDSQLADSVRLTGTILKGALYEAAVTLGTPPMETWNMPLSEILDYVEPKTMPERPASHYFDRAWRWAEVRENGAELRAMLSDGLTALDRVSHVRPLQ